MDGFGLLDAHNSIFIKIYFLIISLRGKTQEVVDKIGEEKGPCFINYHYKIHLKHEKNRQVPDGFFVNPV